MSNYAYDTYYRNDTKEFVTLDASIDDLAFDKYDIFEYGIASLFCGTAKRTPHKQEATQTLVVTRETRIVTR